MLEWDDLRSFLAVARHGNLSAAARALKVTQTTMARRLDALHARVGAKLLQKTPSGFVLTSAGEQVLANVERIEAEVLSVERAISGQDDKIGGEVRITTVDSFGARLLVPLLKTLTDAQPDLSIELITDTRSLSLSRREADLALRLAEFEQHEAVVRRVADMTFGLYASQDYLEARDAPDFKNGAPGHAIITLQEDLNLLPEAKRLTELAFAARAVLRTNSREAHLQAAQAHYGMVMLPCYLGRGVPGLVEIAAPGEHVVRGIWMGVHQDSRHTPRIRLVMDHITEGLRAMAERLRPAPVTSDGLL